MMKRLIKSKAVVLTVLLITAVGLVSCGRGGGTESPPVAQDKILTAAEAKMGLKSLNPGRDVTIEDESGVMRVWHGADDSYPAAIYLAEGDRETYYSLSWEISPAKIFPDRAAMATPG